MAPEDYKSDAKKTQEEASEDLSSLQYPAIKRKGQREINKTAAGSSLSH